MNGFLRSVSLLALLRMTVGLLLPEGGVRRLCDLLLGMVVMLGTLNAFRRLLTGWHL